MNLPSDHSIANLETRRLYIVIALSVIVITLPYLWAIAITPPGYEYSGLLYNPDDQNVNLAWARQAAQGHFLFRDLFTTEGLQNGERPLFTNIFCWLMGAIAGLTRIPLIWLYHGFRIAGAIALLYGFHHLCRYLTPDHRIRIMAVIFVAFSSGAGWLYDIVPALFENTTLIDRPDRGYAMMPEAFAFPSSLIFPLYISSFALLAVIYWQYVKALKIGEWRPALWAAALAVLLSNIHTYDALPLIAVIGIWTALNSLKTAKRETGEETVAFPLKRRVAMGTLIIVGAALPVIYQYYVFQQSSEFRIKASTPTPAPPLLDVLLSYGLLVPLALYGIWQGRKEAGYRLMALWAVATFIMIYLPVSFARKMIEGLHLPLCFLAAAGLMTLVDAALKRSPQAGFIRQFAPGVVTLLVSISSFQFVIWCLNNAQDNNRSRIQFLMPPLYLSAGDAAMLRALAAQPIQPPRAVLSLRYLGNYIPQATGFHVYLGHWAETLNHDEKLTNTMQFYSGQMAKDDALKFLRDNHIAYVVEGFYERAVIPDDASPSQRLGLQLVESSNGSALYAVP